MLLQMILFCFFYGLIVHIYIIHWSINGYLGCIHVLIIVISAAVDIGAWQYFSLTSFFFFLFCPYLQHMEVPRSGTESEPSLDLDYSRSNARSLTCCATVRTPLFTS